MWLLSKTCKSEQMNVERIIARSFVALGGVFWVIAAFGAQRVYKGEEFTSAVGTALVPLAVTVAALAVGWFYEYLAAAGLLVGVVGVGAWGVIAGWEWPGTWLIMIGVMMAPMVIAALLFMLAARMQKICNLEWETRAKPA